MAHKDDKPSISVLERGGAELDICGTRGMLETSQGGSRFAPMYLGVEAALEGEMSRSMMSWVDSTNIISKLKQADDTRALVRSRWHAAGQMYYPWLKTTSF